MEVTLHRAAQEIPLELDATVLVEWNYEPITNEKYASATPEEQAKMQRPSIGGTTLPGASITVDFPHENLKLDMEEVVAQGEKRGEVTTDEREN